MISTEDWKAEPPMSKTFAQYPLVVLDQQLKNLAKEDDMASKDNRSHVEGTKIPMHCWKCNGTLRPEEAVDLRNGSSIIQYVCVNCLRRWHAGDKPRPVITA